MYIVACRSKNENLYRQRLSNAWSVMPSQVIENFAGIDILVQNIGPRELITYRQSSIKIPLIVIIIVIMDSLGN